MLCEWISNTVYVLNLRNIKRIMLNIPRKGLEFFQSASQLFNRALLNMSVCEEPGLFQINRM